MDASNAAADEYNNVDPRDIMNRDLDGFITGEQDKGHRIILLGDMNQDLSSRQRTKLTFGELCKRRKLYSALYAHEENLRPSHKRGKRVIDHIVLGSIHADAIIRSGQLPHGVGFANSDHRGVYLDLDSRPGLDVAAEELATGRTRKLVSKITKMLTHT